MSNFKVGDVVKTRDGREVEILKVDAPGDFPIVIMNTKTGEAYNRTVDGRGLLEGTSMYDLIPPKRTLEVAVYINIYECEGRLWSVPFDSEAVAKYSALILDKRITSLAVAVPYKITVEW